MVNLGRNKDENILGANIVRVLNVCLSFSGTCFQAEELVKSISDVYDLSLYHLIIRRKGVIQDD